MTPPRSLPRLALPVLLAGSLCAQATVFKGTPGGVGDVWIYTAPGSPGNQPSELHGIVLLPVDAAGRSELTRFQPDQPRLKSDVPLASRVLLPQGQGSLYRYRRDRTGGADFGYFVVRPDGLAAFLASFPGSGPSGTTDPVPNPVAVSPQGDAFVTATTREAGGDLFEVGIASASVHLLTAGLPPQDTTPQGLILLPTWGAAMTNSGALRFDRGGIATRVALQPRFKHAQLATDTRVLTHFGDGLVKSADNSTVAVVAGFSAAQSHVFAFGAHDDAVCVNDAPAPILDPGFGTQAAPRLALAPDGNRVAWKTSNAVSGECFSRVVSRVGLTPEVHITSDQRFGDTLNDTGVISFFGHGKVAMLVGEKNAAGGVEHADLFVADFTAGAATPAMTNLTQTSGDSVAPFTVKGDIETADGMVQVPGEERFVYFVPGHSGQGHIYRADAASGQVDTIRSGVDILDFMERAGSSFVLGFLNDSPATRELLQVPFAMSAPATSLGTFQSTQLMLHTNGNPDGTFAAILNAGTSHMLGTVSLHPNGGSGVLTAPQLGPVLGFDGAGAALFSVPSQSLTLFMGVALGGATELYSFAQAGLVLPAN